MSLVKSIESEIWDRDKIKEGSVVTFKIKKSLLDENSIDDSRLTFNGLVTYVGTDQLILLYCNRSRTEELYISIKSTKPGWDSYPDVEVEVVKY